MAPTRAPRCRLPRTPPTGGCGSAWVNEEGGRLYAKLGDASGAGGTLELLRNLPGGGFNIAQQTTASATGERLVLATDWDEMRVQADTVWATVVDPP